TSRALQLLERRVRCLGIARCAQSERAFHDRKRNCSAGCGPERNGAPHLGALDERCRVRRTVTRSLPTQKETRLLGGSVGGSTQMTELIGYGFTAGTGARGTSLLSSVFACS